MRLQDFMTTDVETIPQHDTAEKAYQQMQRSKIRHLVAVEGKTLVGVVSERDLGRFDKREREGLRVSDVMAKPAITANPWTTVREAANLMRGCTIGSLPVVDDDKLVGIVTITDLLDLLGQGTVRTVADTEKRAVSRENPGAKPASLGPPHR